MSGTALDFDAPALLESLRGRGAVVSVKGDGACAWLNVAPRAVLSDNERADFRQHKRELIALLESPDVATVAHRWKSAAPDDDIARARVKPEFAQRMDDADVLQLGRLLLKLDAGEEIE